MAGSKSYAGLSALGVLVLLLLSGCGTAKPPAPPKLVLTMTVAADANPDPAGHPLPIVVRYYQLGATGAFETADYFQLHNQEEPALGKDLIDKQDITLTPGQTRTLNLEAKPGAKFIGIVASYRNINKAVWHADAPISGDTKLKVDIANLKVTVSAN